MKKVILFVMTMLTCTGVANADPIWIDVRSVEEYSTDHIEGDTNIPLATLDAESLAATYGKDAELMLYCRSGNRSGQALEILKAAGFTNVTNAGGIAAVRNQRALSEQDSAQSPAVPAN